MYVCSQVVCGPPAGVYERVLQVLVSLVIPEIPLSILTLPSYYTNTSQSHRVLVINVASVGCPDEGRPLSWNKHPRS
jgi:hypothetical protein